MILPVLAVAGLLLIAGVPALHQLVRVVMQSAVALALLLLLLRVGLVALGI